ncbi:MAG: pyridoxal-dependent decarboxylase [Bacteroidota bacterium]|nr:pyridoxal-dependent decarboxylase [Bacteroidota bacterium]
MAEEFGKYNAALSQAHQLANEFLDGLDNGAAGVTKSYDQLLSAWHLQLPEHGMAADEVIAEMAKAAMPGLMRNQSGRFFSWVIGGTHPSALGADWLTSAWNQNSGMFTVAPAASIAEEIAGKWLKQILHLPDDSSFAFVTGCQMAHFTCLSAARNHIFHTAGWDIETQGFFGAPAIKVICSDQKHVTVNRALRMLGFGTNIMTQVKSDDSGRIDVADFELAMMKDADLPTLVLLQAGDLNTGAYDDFEKIIPIARKYNSWVHVDGAFGLWAAASSKYKHLTKGVALADSWATDGHKWLNVPYDCGYAFTAHPDAHRRAMSQPASYLTHKSQSRDQMDWNPEFSRRGRGFATYAVIRELGTKGIEELINRTCEHAHTIVTEAGKFKNVEVVAIPIINQGLLRFLDPNGVEEADHDSYTEEIIHKINLTGEAFFQPTTYKGKRCMRVSVSGWRTNEEDVERTVRAIGEALSTD